MPVYKKVTKSSAMYRSPLRRPFMGRVIFGIIFIISFGAAAILTLTLVGEAAYSDASGILWEAVLYSSIASIPPILLMRFLDRREKESHWIFLGSVLLWGALISTGLSLVGNEIGTGIYLLWVDEFSVAEGLAPEDTEALLFLSAAVVAPIVEEIAKGLGIILLLWFVLAEFNSMRDGIIFGALIGIGFNLTEAAFYVLMETINGVPNALALQLTVRYALFGLGGHMLFSALVGAGLGRARQLKNPLAKLFWTILGFVMGIAAHAVANSIVIIALPALLDAWGYIDLDARVIRFDEVPTEALWLATVIVSLVSHFIPIIFLFNAVVRSGRWERETICEQLKDEPPEVITPAEYDALKKERMGGLRKIPNAPRKLSRKLVNAQNEFALRKWAVLHDGRPVEQDGLLMLHREEILELRGKLDTAR